MKQQNIPETLLPDVERLCAMRPWASARYSLSDVGNGYLFADFYKDVARFVADRGCWYVYNGCIWAEDRGAFSAMSLCKRLVHLLGYVLGEIESEESRDRFTQHLNRWRTRRTREIALKEAAEVYPMKMSDFDRDPLMFNCLNGTVALGTGELHPHAADDYITRLAQVSYDPSADTTEWEQFVVQIMETNNAFHPELHESDEEDVPAVLASAEKHGYLQKAFGYALCGWTHHECLFLLHGSSTRNGKSTLVETFAAMMGTYAATAMPDTLAAQTHNTSRGPSEDLARLTGARFLSIAEPDQSLRLSASLVKQLTGGDAITCRFLHENSFQYKPQFKIFINTNHLPQVTDDTLFSSDRMRVIEFERHFAPEERDLMLKQKLLLPDVQAGVLNWAITGFRRLMAEGLTAPEFMRSKAEDYRLDSDPVAQFVAEKLVPEPGWSLRLKDVFRDYQYWCSDNGYTPTNSTQFRKALSRHGSVTRSRPSSGGSTTTTLKGFRMIQ